MAFQEISRIAPFKFQAVQYDGTNQASIGGDTGLTFDVIDDQLHVLLDVEGAPTPFPIYAGDWLVRNAYFEWQERYLLVAAGNFDNLYAD